jgi:hypothetical protein
MSEQSYNEFVDPETNQNNCKIYCSRCDCLILTAFKAKYSHISYDLPLVKKQKSEIIAESTGDYLTESIQSYWLINDMLTFENIGFTHAIANIKYLLCADCEVGPLGYQDTNNKDELFVACSRVKHSSQKK